MYFSKDSKIVLKDLNSNDKGLTEKDAKERLSKYGKNLLPNKKRDSILKIFLRELSAPIEVILLITVFISFLIGETVDALVILFIILVDVIMGTYQENKALKSAEALTKMLKVKAKVMRDGKEAEIDSEDIVVGDIILLDSGTKITADARILTSQNLQIDESVLTGESKAASKDEKVISKDAILAERSNMVFAGTSVMTGRAKAVVVATARDTELGKIANTVAETKEEKSPLTIRIEKFSKQISIVIIIVAILSGLLLYYKGYEINAIFLSVVALAVSAMPEGLSLALTMALTIASNKMSKVGVLVKKLNSVESLGSCTVIATDKTGTLTVNEQTAKKIVLADGNYCDVTGTGYNSKGKIIPHMGANLVKIKKIIELCSINNEAHFEEKENHTEFYGDSIDIAFLVLKEKAGINSNLKIEKIIPYESEKQYSAVFYRENGVLRCTVKGALEKVMSFSKEKSDYIDTNEQLSKEGYRIIAVCDGKVSSIEETDIKNLTFLGQVAFIDPIRESAKDSVKECEKAGIKVIMVTGDHPLTAYAIAKELTIVKKYSEVTTGKEVANAYEKGEEHFDKFIKDKKVFSRVTPLDKLHIVDALKRMDEFVAVTGDGVNDAPAIKSANIGIAMGSGTDVAKDTADMIILDDNFKSIVTGIKEGRIAYSNVRKITLFLLSCGFAEVLFYLMSVGLGYDLPLLAIQLLWINVVTDGIQDIALSFEKGENEIMNEKPRSTKESLFSKDLMIEVGLFGLVISLLIFITWKFLMDRNVDVLYARSIVMMLMVFIQNIHVLNCRSEKNSIFTTSIKSNPLVIYTIIGSMLLQFVVTETPLFSKFLNITSVPISVVITLFGLSIFVVVFAEIYKLIYRARREKN